MDKQALLRGIGVTAELVGTPLSADAIEIMANDLMELAANDGDIVTALIRVRREHKGRLSLAVIIENLPNRPPKAEAAWDAAMQARIWDESLTTVIPEAIFVSFPFSIWNQGDRIAARMAFKESYPAHLQKHGGHMAVILGNDLEGRAPIVLAALRDGIISRNHARAVLPPGRAGEIDAIAPPAEKHPRLTSSG